MTTTSNKDLADRVWDAVWRRGELDRIDELFAPDFVRHDPGREIHGPAENRQFIASLRAAFPDLRVTVEDQIADGDKVCARYRFEGTNTGPFNGMPPTDTCVTYTGILIYRIANDRIAEQWTEFNLFGLLSQLGALPVSANPR